jgi:DNA polymerase-3 subunit epsilon
MRHIVLDTETTGLDPASGHRIVEIGCVELINHIATGNDYHVYLNPERDMPEEAFNVHGLSEEFLADKPLFQAVADDFLAFIGDAPLVIHNAEFDMKFLNAELAMLGRDALPMSRTIDTVRMARKRFPGARASLDALCQRFGIDLSARDKHGALLDAQLLGEVFLELQGGREPGLALDASAKKAGDAGFILRRERREPRPHALTAEERAKHEEFLGKLKDPVWKRTGSDG